MLSSTIDNALAAHQHNRSAPTRTTLQVASRQHLWRATFLAVCIVGATVSGSAQEWTRFRGPNGTGVSQATGIPATWSQGDYNWQVPLPGQGHSSPVLWGEKIFLTSAEQDGAHRVVLCLDAADGRIVWQRRYPATTHAKHQLNSFASPTPAVDAERVYVSWSSPEAYLLVALDHAGEEVWRCDLGSYTSQHSAGPSPVVYRDLVVLGNEQDGESSIVAVDRATGEIRWRTPRRQDKVSYSTPCIMPSADGREELVLLSSAHGVYALDPMTGKPLWETAVFDKRTVSSPVFGEGLVIGTCGSGAGGNFVAAVRPGRAGMEPHVAFKIEKSAPYVPTPIVKENRLYLWSDQGVAAGVELPSGKVLWQKRVGGNFFGSPVWVAGNLYCLSSDGEAVVIAAADEFIERGRMPLGELSHSTPAVAGGRMYLRTQSRLFSLGSAQ